MNPCAAATCAKACAADAPGVTGVNAELGPPILPDGTVDPFIKKPFFFIVRTIKK